MTEIKINWKKNEAKEIAGMGQPHFYIFTMNGQVKYVGYADHANEGNVTPNGRNNKMNCWVGMLDGTKAAMNAEVLEAVKTMLIDLYRPSLNVKTRKRIELGSPLKIENFGMELNMGRRAVA